MKKERIVVVCPGRGSYNKDSLQYLRTEDPRLISFLKDLDQRRLTIGEPLITEMDQAKSFAPSLHTRGEHASVLIYACATADFFGIDRDRFEVVAITGNSMGWYIACALAGSLDSRGAFDVIQTMGSMMKDEIIGGQIIYPVTGSDWVRDEEMERALLAWVDDVHSRPDHEAYVSIRLGGFIVLGGNRQGLAALMKELPKIEHYPLQLINHAAFHTPLLRETSDKAFAILPPDLLQKPKVSMIDGRGAIWRPWSTNTQELYNYTLGHQVYEPYDFSRAIEVAIKEFAPDRLVLLGPGNSLGAPVGQILIRHQWLGLKNKAEFSELQNRKPFVLTMDRSRPDQREFLISAR